MTFPFPSTDCNRHDDMQAATVNPKASARLLFSPLSFLVLLTTALTVVTLSSSVNAQIVGEPTQSGGYVIIGKVRVGDLMFHPLYVSLDVEREISALVYGDGLLRSGDSDLVEPGLATEVPMSTDGGRTWVFRLRQGIVFHDGVPLTAQDVVFSYYAYKQSRSYAPVFHRHFQNLDTVSAPDPLTVRVALKEPSKQFPSGLGKAPILPKHQMDRQLIADAFRAPDPTRPIGLGPFRVETWPYHDTVILSANKAWYRGKPYLDGVIYKFYPSTEELQAAFVKREVDVVEVDRAKNFGDIKRARGDAKIQAIQPRGQAFTGVFYNLQNPVLTDRAVRQALAYATDRQHILDQVMLPGAGEAANSPVSESYWATGGATAFKFDPNRGLALLHDAGWQDTDHDGILNFAKRKLQFELLFPMGSLSAERIVRMIKLNLNDIGVSVIPIPLEQKELVERLRVGAFDAALFVQDFEPTADDFYTLFHSESIDIGFNVMRYLNRQVDRNISFLFGINDRARALPIYQGLQLLISSDQPCMFLYFIKVRYLAYDPRIRNIGPPGARLNPPDKWFFVSDGR